MPTKYYPKSPAQLEIARVRNFNKRAALNGASEEITLAELRSVLARHGGRCTVCGSDDRLAVDHIVPLVRGGRNDINNLQPLCKSCNSRKWCLPGGFSKGREAIIVFPDDIWQHCHSQPGGINAYLLRLIQRDAERE